jgi:hypothetical protein
MRKQVEGCGRPRRDQRSGSDSDVKTREQEALRVAINVHTGFTLTGPEENLFYETNI